jgi:hypothetical protein
MISAQGPELSNDIEFISPAMVKTFASWQTKPFSQAASTA